MDYDDGRRPDLLAEAHRVYADLDRDPELRKLVNKRSAEQAVPGVEALAWMLPGRPGESVCRWCGAGIRPGRGGQWGAGARPDVRPWYCGPSRARGKGHVPGGMWPERPVFPV